MNAGDILGFECVNHLKMPPWPRFDSLEEAIQFAKDNGSDSVWVRYRQTVQKVWSSNGDMRCAWPEPLERNEYDWSTKALAHGKI